MNKIAFFDRDGTLNKEVNYLHRYGDFKWIDGAPDFLKSAADAGYTLAVVSNQSGVARKLFSKSAVADLHEQMNNDLEKRVGVRISHFEICPHHPDFTGACDCRKPSPRMLERIAEKMGNIDKERSFMVGDKLSDYRAGLNFGIRSYLINTGHLLRSDELALANCIESLRDIEL
jgi:histidinol-phosphate phosphatase family protein